MGKSHPWFNTLGSPMWRRGTPATVPFQGKHTQITAIPVDIAQMIYEEYSDRYGGGQSFERIHERGGFGVAEAIAALADIIERERSEKKQKAFDRYMEDHEETQYVFPRKESEEDYFNMRTKD